MTCLPAQKEPVEEHNPPEGASENREVFTAIPFSGSGCISRECLVPLLQTKKQNDTEVTQGRAAREQVFYTSSSKPIQPHCNLLPESKDSPSKFSD